MDNMERLFGWKWTDEDWERYKRAFDSDMIPSVFKAKGVSPTRLFRTKNAYITNDPPKLTPRKVEISGRQEIEIPSHKLTKEERIWYMRELSEAGYIIPEIAERLHLSILTIKKYAHQYRIRVKTKFDKNDLITFRNEDTNTAE